MNYRVLYFLALFLIAVPAFSGGPSSGSNPWVATAVSAAPAKLRAGASTELRISLKPAAGIHIVLQPAIDVKLDSVTAVAGTGTLQVPAAADKEHLDPAHPVRLKITLAKDVRPGTLTLKGTLVYYYCSDAEGTCNKFKQPLELRLSVVR